MGMGDGLVALGWGKGRQQAAVACLSFFSFFLRSDFSRKKREELCEGELSKS